MATIVGFEDGHVLVNDDSGFVKKISVSGATDFSQLTGTASPTQLPAAQVSANPTPNWANVKSYGAVGDGVTDDTAAIGAALLAAATILNSKNGPSAPAVYFPASSGPYKFNGSVFSQTYNKGWLYVIMENSFFLTGPVTPSSYMAFIGRGGNFQGLGGLANYRPNVTWYVAADTECLNSTGISAANSVYFEGINFENRGPSATSSPVHIQGTKAAGGGPAFYTWVGCQFGSNSTAPALLMDTDDAVTVCTFGQYFTNCAFSTATGAKFVIDAHNCGQFTFHDCAIYDAPIRFINDGIASAGGVVFDTVQSEGLNNKPFLLIDTTSGGAEDDFTLRHCALADTIGSVYVVKGLGTHINGINFDMMITGNIGLGLIDPTGTAIGITGVVAKGAGADAIHGLPAMSAALQSWIEIPTNGRPISAFSNIPGGLFPSLAAGNGFAENFSTVAAATYTLTYADGWVNFTNSSPTVTVPHALSAAGLPPNTWHIFNAGSGNLTLKSDSGNVNGVASITIPTMTGKTVKSDGTNVWAM